ncbi:MAG: alkaline phosphatase D family protein, partial [Spirochaetota bacterium]
IWQPILREKADIFIFLGDNIYSDTSYPLVLQNNYKKLLSNKNFQTLRSQTKVFAIWDDHDYGKNDAGREYSIKKASQKAFAAAFELQKKLGQRKGTYQSYLLGPPGKKVHLVLLDTRYFRSKPSSYFWGLDWFLGKKPNWDTKATVLGEKQWLWLQKELQKKADLRIVASSIQLIPDKHKYEKWANFPLERQKLLRLLQNNPARQTIVLSGDRHHSELSVWPSPSEALLYELTASPLNQTSTFPHREYNPYRIYHLYSGANYGKIEINWQPRTRVFLSIHDVKGRIVFRHGLQLESKKNQ